MPSNRAKTSSVVSISDTDFHLALLTVTASLSYPLQCIMPRQEKFGMQKSILIAKKVSACGMACEQWKRDQVAAWLAYVVVSMTSVCPSCLAVCLVGAHCVCVCLWTCYRNTRAPQQQTTCAGNILRQSVEKLGNFSHLQCLYVCVCVCLL